MEKKQIALIIIGGIILFFLTMFEITGSMTSSLFPNVIVAVFIIYGLVIWILKNHKEIAKPKEIFKKDNELNTKRVICTVLLVLIFLGSSIPVISYSIEKTSAPIETYIPSTQTTSSVDDNSTTETNTSDDYDDGDWKTVTMEFPHIITDADGEIYYEGYAFSFQIKGDSSSTMFVVPDNLYYDKFINYATKSKIKIKYHSGTGKANNGATFPINIVDDVKTV